MAIGNKIILGKEYFDTSQEEPISDSDRGIKKIRPKFAPGMRFPCQE